MQRKLELHQLRNESNLGREVYTLGAYTTENQTQIEIDVDHKEMLRIFLAIFLACLLANDETS